MTSDKPIEWEIWTLAEVAKLPIEPRAHWLTCCDLITAVEHTRPIHLGDGIFVLSIGRVDGAWVDTHELAKGIKAILHADPCMWLELVDDPELGTFRGEVSREPTPTSARTPALAGGDALQREEQRLEAEGRADLVPVLRLYAQRWQDYRIPVWRLPE